jgi:hypothetical protein
MIILPENNSSNENDGLFLKLRSSILDDRFWQIVLDLDPNLGSSTLDLIVFFSQSVSSERISTIPCFSFVACRFLFLFFVLFYGLGRWAEYVNNASGFRVERGMLWVWVFCSCLGNGFLATGMSLC